MAAEVSNAKRMQAVEANVASWHRAHVMALIRECDIDCDVDYMADALLAPLAPPVYLYQRNARQMPVSQIEAGYEQLVRRLLS